MAGAAARAAAPGAWVLTSMAWHEPIWQKTGCRPMPSSTRPRRITRVLARRGGHLAVASTAALRAAGIGAGTPDQPGGKIGRLPDGRPSGVLEGGAVWQVSAHAPAPTRAELAQALCHGSAAYAALGGRHHPRGAGRLPRGRRFEQAERAGPAAGPVGNELAEDQAIALIDGLGAPGGGDDWLRVWGLKLVMDGGVEGGAPSSPRPPAGIPERRFPGQSPTLRSGK